MTYTFGSLCLDAGARTLSSSTEGVVHLTRKAFDLLLLLLELRPNAVSKEQIYAHLWPDIFVAESALQTLVHEIRQAIDDRELEHSWIRTVHGIGYRFAGHVVASDAVPSAKPGHPAAWLLGESIRVPLHAGENILGRGLEDVTEVEAPTISRRHARIVIAESVTLEDLGSKNGTWLEDERLTARRALADGDVVRLGSATFTFRLVRQPKSTESAEIRQGDLDVTSG